MDEALPVTSQWISNTMTHWLNEDFFLHIPSPMTHLTNLDQPLTCPALKREYFPGTQTLRISPATSQPSSPLGFVEDSQNDQERSEAEAQKNSTQHSIKSQYFD